MKSILTALTLSTMIVPAMAGDVQELAGKLGMEQGNTASMHINVSNGNVKTINDGDPNIYYFDESGNSKSFKNPRAAYPLPGGPGTHHDGWDENPQGSRRVLYGN